MQRSLLAGLLLVGMFGSNRVAGAMELGQVKTFMYLLQNVEKPEVVEKLAASDYDMVVIRKAAREINPQAVVIQQNAYGLIDEDRRLVQAIDGMGVEDTWLSGKANAKWEGKNAGDLPNKARGDDSTQSRLKKYQKFLEAGKPVFTIDYCVNREHAQQVYKDARAAGLIPLVTRVSLDRLTETPPVVAPTTLPGVTGASSR